MKSEHEKVNHILGCQIEFGWELKTKQTGVIYGVSISQRWFPAIKPAFSSYSSTSRFHPSFPQAYGGSQVIYVLSLRWLSLPFSCSYNIRECCNWERAPGFEHVGRLNWTCYVHAPLVDPTKELIMLIASPLIVEQSLPSFHPTRETQLDLISITIFIIIIILLLLLQ